MLFHLFHSNRVQFTKVDPEDNGLLEEIAAERLEPEAISSLDEGIDAQRLSDSWQEITSDLEQDPDWFKFTEE